MKQINLKTLTGILILIFFSMTMVDYAGNVNNETLEYSVISINKASWIVTAKEVATGNIVKFRLPPSSFLGKTFDADLKNIKKGQAFVARSLKNVQLRKLQMKSDYKSKNLSGLKIRNRNARVKKMPINQAKSLNWEIIKVDAGTWNVTAKDRKTGETIQFNADPNGFKNFKFKADLANIRKGQGFSLRASNSKEFRNCLKLIKRRNIINKNSLIKKNIRNRK